MLEPPEILLLGPGPSPSSPHVRRAQSKPQLGHLDPDFVPLLDYAQQGLRRLFGTENKLTLPLAGTGSAGMEAIVSNLVEPGDRVVVGVHGVFGVRFADSVRRAGGEAVEVVAEFGQPLDPDAMQVAITAGPTKLCVVVHAETSTGVLTDLAPIAKATRDAGALFAVDCVTSIGGVPLNFDELGVDAAFCGTQKCLSVPPGLAPVTFSERALERVHARTHPVPFYFDTKLLNGYFGSERSYHYTAPISMIYALVASLEEIEAEGLEARYARHRDVSAALRRGLGPLGLTPLVPVEHATPMLTTVCYPDGIDDAAFRHHLRQQHRIEVGGGLGPLAGKVFRVGLMGHGARLENVLRALAAFGDALAAAGHVPDVSASLAAVHGD
ncbi:MAG: alanine-glyoxylate transaminase/serine-glyoxylate transaminase/serine-pyruvate transaminase [Planctomycetota bacterium]|jgi:alanine-glyoxylate transaminase/serine-glyoxylate transaminase/serine-pyruvate transaminase